MSMRENTVEALCYDNGMVHVIALHTFQNLVKNPLWVDEGGAVKADKFRLHLRLRRVAGVLQPLQNAGQRERLARSGAAAHVENARHAGKG